MIQKIIDGIVDALDDAFPGVTIHDETVKQDLDEPCFIIQCVNPTSEQFLGKRYHRTNLFSIQYIPESVTDAKRECAGVTDALFQALEYITVDGDLQRGTSMNGEYFGGVLTFMVNFNMFVRVETELDPMEKLKIENSAK